MALPLDEARDHELPLVTEQLFKKFRGLEIMDCPFVNLPEAKSVDGVRD
jgi:hypothetical protein